jgi:hypothetical protein
MISDDLVKVALSLGSIILGGFLGNILNFKSRDRKQKTENFDIITEKYETLYEKVLEQNSLLEIRLGEVLEQNKLLKTKIEKQERIIIKLTSINKNLRKKVNVLLKEGNNEKE